MIDPTTANLGDETVTAFLSAVPAAKAAFDAANAALAARFPVGEVAYGAEYRALCAYLCRKAQIWQYLGKTVKIGIDRPIGYVHTKGAKTLVLPINYGYIPGILGGDGEELDVYVADSVEPCESCCVRIIGAVHRADDTEDKLIGTLSGDELSAEVIAHQIEFAEKYYRTRVQTLAEKNTLFWDL